MMIVMISADSADSDDSASISDGIADDCRDDDNNGNDDGTAW